MGDFNIDVSSNSISKIRLDNWCKDFNFKQLVKSPTRDAVNCKGHPTSSCINLFITRSNKKMNIAFKDCTFSDHKAVFLQIGRFNHKKERIQVRRWLFDQDVFAFACSTKPSLSPNVSLEDNARIFTEWLSSVSDRATSFKWSVKRDPSKFKPWYTDDLKRLKQITLIREISLP